MKSWNDSLTERFDSYMKKSLKNCKNHARKTEKNLEEHELLVCMEEQLYASSDSYHFLENKVQVMNFDMTVTNDLLYEALRVLEQHHRDIIYLSLCEEWSDKRISKQFNMSKSKVQRLKIS